MNEGWKCPVCGKGNAPFQAKCLHCADTNYPDPYQIPQVVPQSPYQPIYPTEPWYPPVIWYTTTTETSPCYGARTT